MNNEMTFLYWNIGRDITENVLNNQKAEYGKSVIKKLSKKLVSEYGRGYGERNIFRMLKFYDYFPNFEILSTLSTKLSWSHFVELLQIPEKLKRDFYATMCSNEFWGVRTLRERIGSALFERTAISKKPEQTIIIYNANLVEAAAKYKDVYQIKRNEDGTTSNRQEDCYEANNLKVGDALWEVTINTGSTYGWYGDSSRFVGLDSSHNPVFKYGGHYEHTGTQAGIFYAYRWNGDINLGYSFRVVCVVE